MTNGLIHVAARGREDINPASGMTAGATVAVGVEFVIGKTITAVAPAGIATPRNVLAATPGGIWPARCSPMRSRRR